MAAFDPYLDLTRHADGLRKDTAAIIAALLSEDAPAAQAGILASDCGRGGCSIG